jgi:HK97 family phage portal protein
MRAGDEFEALSWKPEDMQMVEARRFTLNEWEMIFGLPVGWLGGTDSSRKYSNMSQDDLHLLKWSLSGHLARFEQTLSLAFPRGTTVKANLDAVLRADTLTRYQAHAIGIDKGFLLQDEAREYEDLPPLPEKPPQLDAFTSTPSNEESPNG